MFGNSWLLRVYSSDKVEVTGLEQCQGGMRDSSLCMGELPRDSGNELSGGVGYSGAEVWKRILCTMPCTVVSSPYHVARQAELEPCHILLIAHCEVVFGDRGNRRHIVCTIAMLEALAGTSGTALR